MKYIKYLLAGVYFGVVLIKAEVASWFRIQEMFRFQSFYMYGVIGMAVAVGVLSVYLIKKFNIKTIEKEEIVTVPKTLEWKSNFLGGTIFGLGWALTGACPGPLYALVGSGYFVIGAAILSAMLGVYVYGLLKDFLPH